MAMMVSPTNSLRSSLNPDFAQEGEQKSSFELMRETLQDVVRTTNVLLTSIKSDPNLKRALSGGLLLLNLSKH